MSALKYASIIAVIAITGCGTTGKFVYPAKMSTMFKSSSDCAYDKTIAVIPFDDYRGDDNSMAGYYLYMLPLCPWGKLEYDRPEAARFFNSIQEFDATPSEDLAKAVAVSFRHSNLFKDAFFTMGGEKDRADFVIRGRLKEMRYEGKVYSYGLSIVGPCLWYIGAPACNSVNTISYELEMRNKQGKIVWDYSFARSNELMQWLYYRIGDDCKGFSYVFQESMNEALSNLAAKMDKNPELFK